MFLEIPEKIKWCRKKYHLKQEMFQVYGISRSYISMVENGRRVLPDEMVDTIYEVLCKLTNEAVQGDFTVASFKQSSLDQARDWLSARCRLETFTSEYDLFKKVVAQYELYDYGVKLEEYIAIDYQRQNRWIESNQHYSLAISYASLASQNPTALYREIGLNMEKMGLYEESISYLNLSLHSLTPDMKELRYKVLYNLGRGYMNTQKFDIALNHIDLIFKEGETPQPETLGAAILLKGVVLKNNGQNNEAIALLKSFIDDPCYPPFLTEVYHNLAHLYKIEGRFDEALEVLAHLLTVLTYEPKKHLAMGLMGDIYYELKQYDLAEEYLVQSKKLILTCGSFEQVKVLVLALMNIYVITDALYEMIELFDEMNQYIQEKVLSPASLHYVKSVLFDKFYQNEIDEQQFKLWMFNLEQLQTC